MKIQIDFQPAGRKVEVQKGATIMEAAQSAGVGLLATCGGQSSCGSCVIRLISDTPADEPGFVEKENFTQAELDAGYRLACQTRLFASAIVNIPSQSLSAPQRLQVEGKYDKVEFEPKIRVVNFYLPTNVHQNPHDISEYILIELKKYKCFRSIAVNEEISTSAMKTAAENQGEIRVVIYESEIILVIPPNTPVLGMAVDIGTTKIAGYLVDLVSGINLSKKGCINPQIAYGDDVMARITYALASETGAGTLQASVIDALNQLAADLCTSAQSDNVGNSVIPSYHPSQITEMVLVGNTAMHHICLGLPLQQLGRAPYVPAVSKEMDLSCQELKLTTSPSAFVHLLPNVAGFVGADHVSMLLSSGIMKESQNTLYIDIGTNTEITLLIDNRMHSCSTASGPAFEGAHIHDGMRAADGAIERIWIVDNHIRYQTINDKRPIGICGSGIIDGIAQMLMAGIINERGALDSGHPLVRKGEKCLELVIAPSEDTGHGRDIIINRKDISEIQLAKGAIQAGLELLLAETGNNVDQIERVIVAGAFGSFIDIKSAKTIGLFPNLATSQFKQVGNAAGMGAIHSLLSLRKRTEASVIAKKLEYLELAAHNGFTDAFARAMMFEPGLTQTKNKCLI